MDILHIYKDYYPVLGGIENHIKALAEAQVSAGHRVAVLVTNRNSRMAWRKINGVRIILAGRLTTISSMPISLSQGLTLARLRPELVHLHSPYPLGEVNAWLFQHSTPTVITHHSDIVRQKFWLKFYGPLLRRILLRVHRIIATSPRYIETSPWLMPVREKCVVVPLGIDDHQFVPAPEAFVGPPTLLFVGKLRYYKGLDTLLKAMVHLPNVQLKIVGDGPMKASWQRLAMCLGIHPRIYFLGEIDDIDLFKVYHQAHLFVLPSNVRAEAFGTTLLEAMASGLPCVTTEVGTGTSWVVQDGLNGLVVPPRDPNSMADAIQSLLNDPDRCRAMGRAGRQKIIHEFSQSLMVSRIEQVYRDALYFGRQSKKEGVEKR